MSNVDNTIEAQVRREFRAQFRAKMLLVVHTILYLLFIVGFAFTGPGLSEITLIWTALLGVHSVYFYYAHGKGKARREEKIYAEVERRERLMVAHEKLKNADGTRYELSDDGELFDEDDFASQQYFENQKRG